MNLNYRHLFTLQILLIIYYFTVFFLIPTQSSQIGGSILLLEVIIVIGTVALLLSEDKPVTSVKAAVYGILSGLIGTFVFVSIGSFAALLNLIDSLTNRSTSVINEILIFKNSKLALSYSDSLIVGLLGFFLCSVVIGFVAGLVGSVLLKHNLRLVMKKKKS